MIWHLLPQDEEHEEKSTCSCNPEIEVMDESGDILVIHNSFDNRVIDEFVSDIINSYE